ncbi:MAG TPA: hypothetical protein VF510_25580 [Ktedonobacterales bacterium]
MMIRYSAEQQQTVPSHQLSWLRVGLAVALDVVLMLALLVAIAPALLALQHNGFALLAPFLNYLPRHASSHELMTLTCGGLILPC